MGISSAARLSWLGLPEGKIPLWKNTKVKINLKAASLLSSVSWVTCLRELVLLGLSASQFFIDFLQRIFFNDDPLLENCWSEVFKSRVALKRKKIFWFDCFNLLLLHCSFMFLLQLLHLKSEVIRSPRLFRQFSVKLLNLEKASIPISESHHVPNSITQLALNCSSDLLVACMFPAVHGQRWLCEALPPDWRCFACRSYYFLPAVSFASLDHQDSPTCACTFLPRLPALPPDPSSSWERK